jgi:hypothetical protein
MKASNVKHVRARDLFKKIGVLSSRFLIINFINWTSYWLFRVGYEAHACAGIGGHLKTGVEIRKDNYMVHINLNKACL